LRTAGGAPLHTFVVAYSRLSTPHEERLAMTAALIEPRRKLIETFEEQTLELYDPVADPAEENELGESERDTLARMRRQLAIYRDIDQ
jgi:hypothetical protein